MTDNEKIFELATLVKSGEGTKVEIDGEIFVNHDRIETLCCDLFMTNGGDCNWKNMGIFEETLLNARVVALDKDSFGWLVGGIKYEGRIYSYG